MTRALPVPPVRRRLPAIARDDCTGCNRCVAACPRGCLELVWDFATLVRAGDCDGCSLCEQACPHGVIRLAWQPAPGRSGHDLRQGGGRRDGVG